MVSFKGKEEEEGRRYSISTAVYLAEKCKYKNTGSSLGTPQPPCRYTNRINFKVLHFALFSTSHSVTHTSHCFIPAQRLQVVFSLYVVGLAVHERNTQ